jgi:hypothetical protein
MSKIFVTAEHLDGKLNPSTAPAESAASTVKTEAIGELQQGKSDRPALQIARMVVAEAAFA